MPKTATAQQIMAAMTMPTTMVIDPPLTADRVWPVRMKLSEM
jgi:hypothetical protein